MGKNDHYRHSAATKGKHFQSNELPQEDYDNKIPVFSLRHMRRGSDYCITKCEPHDRSSFADTLSKISEFTWIQLRSMGRHRGGYELLPQGEIKKVPPHTLTPDQKFTVFRFSGMKPMVGYREKDIFHILWLDREFNLYNHGE